MSRLWIALRGFGYAALFLTLWTLAALMFRPLDKYIPIRIPNGLGVPGFVLVLAGIALTLITSAYFVFEGRGTPAIFDPPIEFVPHGLNRLVRNPMYIGYVIGLLGLGLCFRSVSMVLFALVALLSIHIFVVLAEEPGLRRRFGTQYDEYCRAVPRWIPRFTQRHLPT